MKNLFHITICCVVFTTLPVCAQLNLGKLKNKAGSAISNSGDQNTATTNNASSNSGGAKLFNGKDPFNGSGNTIVTLAGSGSMNEFGFKDEKGRDALFDHPEGIASDENGNVYVADKLNNRIRKISSTGEVSTFAGSGERDSKNGVSKEAALDQPFYIWYDGSKNFYVIEDRNTIRKINKEGKVSTVYRQKNYPGYTDGEIGDANFDGVRSVVSNSKGEVFILDANNNCIRKISGGVVSTLAGNKNAQLQYETQTKDGAGAKATFWNLKCMVIDKSDNLFVSDGPQRIRKISPDGTVSTLAFDELIKSTKSTYEMDDGNFHGVRDVGVFTELALLSNGNFLISTEGGEIHEVNADLKNIKFVYTGSHCNTFKESDYRGVTDVKDGEDCKGCIGGDKAKKLSVSPDGKLYFSERNFHCIREIKLKR
jgi:hypothetical protein